MQVPFSKPSERYVSILGGHADALYEQAGDVGSFLHGKQMRPILMFGDKRSESFKDVATSYEPASRSRCRSSAPSWCGPARRRSA